MRARKTPFRGWVGTDDQLVSLTGEFSAPLGGLMVNINRPFDFGLFIGTAILYQSADEPTNVQSPSDPTGLGVTLSAASAHWLMDDDHTTASVFAQPWSAAVWYDFSSTATTGTQTVLEVSDTDGGADEAFRLFYEPANNRFGLSWGTTHELFSTAVPTTGMISLDSRTGNTEIDWYHNGRFVTAASMTSANALLGTDVDTPFKYRVVVGASIRTGGDASPEQFMDGTLGRMGVWARDLGRVGHRVAYGDCVRPWDENVLLANDAYRTVERVLVVNDDGSEVDLSTLKGQDWLVSSEINTTVDDNTTTCDIRLVRRLGQYADLSPLNNTPDFDGLLDLRQKIRLERAIVPTDHQIQGWEWAPRFEGLIDAYDIGTDTLDLSCSDRSAALTDAFVLDARAYNYVPSKSFENVLQEIVDDNEPTIRLSTPPVVVGYKGESTAPTVYTLGGSVATPHFEPSGSVFRYNDVSSGPTFDALQAVADQIGYAVRYRWHEDWATERLTAYAPRRTLRLKCDVVGDVTDPTLVNLTSYEPHGFVVDSLASTGFSAAQLQLLTSASHNFYGTVATVTNAKQFSVRNEIGTSLPLSRLSGASVLFAYTEAIPFERVVEIEPLVSQIGSIRNHVVIKHSRYSVPDFAYALTGVEVFLVGGEKLFTIQTDGDLPDLDPDNTGISFTLSGGTGGSAALNGTYTGRQVSRNQIDSDIPTTAGVGFYSTNLPGLTTDFYRYKEVVGTSPTSYNRYGLLSMGVYEGSTLAINTDAEAARLADALISDLALPTADWKIKVKHSGYELHDLLRFGADPKGRWSGTFDTAVVGIKEISASGECYTTLSLRSSVPTNGVGWGSRIAVGSDRPAPLDNYPIKQDADILPGLKIQDAVRRSRSWSFQRRDVARREMGRRHDSTWVWVGTTASFAPTQSTLAGKFRSDNFEITHLGDGSSLVPGQRYYTRFADQDLWGNLSEINGIGAASAALVPDFVPRFLDETAGCTVVGVTGATTFSSSLTNWQFLPNITIKDGSDTAGLSYDTFANYSTTSVAWRVPCDGVVSASHKSAWYGDPLKITSSDDWQVLGRLAHYRESTLIGVYGTDGAAGTGLVTPELLGVTAQVSALSGDWLRFEFRTNDNLVAYPAAGATDTEYFTAHTFAMVNQR